MNSDPELIQATLHGNPRAFEELVMKYQRLVRMCIWNVVRNAATADDVAQEVFLKAHSSLSRLSNPERFKRWLLRIATNESLNFLRVRRIEEVNIEAVSEARLEAKGKQESEGVLDRLEALKTFESLPPIDGMVFWLKFVEDFNSQEIAEILDSNAPAIRKRISRGLGLLREKLDEVH